MFHADYNELSTEELVQHLQELEHSYAEAFADDADSSALSALWEKIKELKTAISRRKEE